MLPSIFWLGTVCLLGLGRNSVAFSIKRSVQNQMDSRIGNGDYNLDYYISCWSFVTHCPGTSIILNAR